MKTPLSVFLSCLTASMLLLATGCAERTETDLDAADTLAVDTTEAPMEMAAHARLAPTNGNSVQGEVTFTPGDNGVRVVARVTGLTPGNHGFHVHETGDCSAPDASSAGGHFAPKGSPHGAPEAPAAERHAGDLGNLQAGQNGTANYDRVDPVLTLNGPASIVGKAVIVHAGQDDFTTQPSGNAGSRLACGVIQMGSMSAASGMTHPDTTATH